MKEFKGPRRQGGWAAVGAIVQGVGGLASSAANRDASAQASVNAKAEAMQALRQGMVDEESQRRQGRQALGEQAAALAESGGTVGSEDLVRQSEANAELDALNVRYGAQNRAAGLFSEAKALKAQSKAYKRNGLLLAGGNALQGYGSYKQSQA